MTGAGSSTATSALGAGGALLLLAGGVVIGLPGWLAYAGAWRRWTSDAHASALPYFPFGLAWLGAAVVLAGLAALIAVLGHIAAIIAYLVLGIPGAVMFCSGLVFFVWTPRRFRPGWYSGRLSTRKGQA